MKKIKGLIFLLLLILLIGAVSASEDANDTVSVPDDNMKLESDTSEPIIAEDDNTEIDDDYTSGNATYEKQLSKPKITVKSTEGYQGKTLTLKATVKTENGTPEKATVTFKFNGKTYTRTTDKNGVASVSIKFPASKAVKTTSKTKKNILTKTTTYKKTYTCTVTVEGDDYYPGEASFKVVSKKKPLVKKYKIIKKKKIVTVKAKNGVKTYKKGNYVIVTYKYKKNGLNYIESTMGKKNSGFISFSVNHHYKANGKWKWDSWFKVPKNKESIFSYNSVVKVDKLKFKYTQVTYKRIK